MSGYGRETASKTAGRLTLEMQPKTRTYRRHHSPSRCGLLKRSLLRPDDADVEAPDPFDLVQDLTAATNAFIAVA